MLLVPAVAGATLLGTVAVGILVHEYLHVLVLRASGVQCELVFRPVRPDRRGFQGVVSGSWASVELEAIPASCSSWRLRAAAMAPLAMLIPVGVVAWLTTTGAVSGSLVTSMVLIGWMGCALPSPADFSMVWHTDEVRAMLSNERTAG